MTGDTCMSLDRQQLGLEKACTPTAEAAVATALEPSSTHNGFVPTLTDFPQRLKRFKEESGLSWAEIARRLGADPKTVRRWHKDGVRPNAHYLLALQDLAKGRGLGHLFTVRTTPYQTAESEGREESGQGPADRTTGGEQNAGRLGHSLGGGTPAVPPEGSAMLCLDSAHTTASVKRP